MAENDFPHLLLAQDRELLETMLEVQRSEMREVAEGLSEDEARRRLVPSLTTSLGLLKHADFVERAWFLCRVGGMTRHEAGIGTDIDASFVPGPQDTIAELVATYDATCAQAREITAPRALTDEFDWRDGRRVSLAFIYAHLIQEYARHCGHGDILREQLIAAR